MKNNTASNKDDFYPEFDERSGVFGVFGTESGFCYSTHCSYAQAKEACSEMYQSGESGLE
jgi:hypothetical protein